MQADRVRALHQHVLELPARVVAEALDCYHCRSTARATHVRATWGRYAAGLLGEPAGWTTRRDS